MNENKIIEISNKTYNYLKEEFKKTFQENKEKEIKIFKPMPAPIDKIQNRHRYRIIIKTEINEEINNILNNYLKKVYEKDLKNIRISIDVNPNKMI